MNDQVKKSLIVTGALFLVFVIYTVCIKVVDVLPTGLLDSSIGFSSINIPVRDALHFNKFFYLVSKLIGVVAILICVFFGFLGLMQIVKRKGLIKADADIYVLGVFYIAVILFYALFEVLIVNYRPVDLGEGLEASYPSSHTMLALCVFITAAFQFNKRIKEEKIKKIVVWSCIGLSVLMVVTRILSGVHWITDIVGALLLSAFLISGYLAGIKFVEKKVT